MPTLIELTAQIVASHASKTVMTQEQLLQDMHLVHEALKSLEQGISPEQPEQTEEPKVSTLTVRQAFKKDEIVCMVCTKGGFKTLKKHLSVAHQLTPGQYRKQFGIKSTQKLAAKSFSDARRQAAVDRGMTDVLAKARETRMANIAKKKAAVPAVKAKPAVPAVKKKAAVPAKVTKKAEIAIAAIKKMSN